MLGFRDYSLGSFVVGGAVVWQAFRVNGEFYPAMLDLTSNKAKFLTICNVMFVIFAWFFKTLMFVFFSQLRRREKEQLMERFALAFTGELLAMTMFYDSLSFKIVTLFGVLLALKLLHWQAADRVDHHSQVPPANGFVTLRLMACLAFLGYFDALGARLCLRHLLGKGPDVLMLFAFEFVMLGISSTRTWAKIYITILRANYYPEHVQRYWVMLIDLIHDFIMCIAVSVFFILVMMSYGLPLHLVRDVIVSYRALRKRIVSIRDYKRALAVLNRLPDAALEDFGEGEVCPICREEMTFAMAQQNARPQGVFGLGSNVVKKLNCGHLFHMNCLRSWMQQQQLCPTCRAPVILPHAGAGAGAPGAPGAYAQPNRRRGNLRVLGNLLFGRNAGQNAARAHPGPAAAPHQPRQMTVTIRPGGTLTAVSPTAPMDVSQLSANQAAGMMPFLTMYALYLQAARETHQLRCQLEARSSGQQSAREEASSAAPSTGETRAAASPSYARNGYMPIATRGQDVLWVPIVATPADRAITFLSDTRENGEQQDAGSESLLPRRPTSGTAPFGFGFGVAQAAASSTPTGSSAPEQASPSLSSQAPPGTESPAGPARRVASTQPGPLPESGQSSPHFRRKLAEMYAERLTPTAARTAAQEATEAAGKEPETPVPPTPPPPREGVAEDIDEDTDRELQDRHNNTDDVT